jgi:hypothetical protein
MGAALWAGAILGCAELALVAVAGPPAPPLLAGALVLGAALVVGALGAALGLLLSWLIPLRPGRALPHSQMVGLLAGPLLLGSGLGASLETWRLSPLAGAVALGLTAAAAIAAALLAGWVGRRLEAAGQPLAGPGVWTALALLLAVAQAPQDVAGPRLLAAGALGAGIVLTLALAARRLPQRPGSWPRRLVLVSLLAAALCAGPSLLPWLLLDPVLAPLSDRGPANLLAVMWPAPRDVHLETLEAESPSLTLLSRQGVSWEIETGGGAVGTDSPAPQGLRDPEGRPLLARLEREGHLTAAIVTRRDADGAGAAEIDFRPGARGYLDGPARRTTAGSVLRALGLPRIGPLDLSAVWRPPGDVTAAGRRWLAAWRGARPDRAFALLLDYRGEEALPGSALEAELASLLDLAAETEALPFSAVLVWLDREGSPAAGTLRFAPRVRRPPAARPAAHEADLQALGGLVLASLAIDRAAQGRVSPEDFELWLRTFLTAPQ